MSDLIGLILPLFAVPKNYTQMLNRLAGFTFYEILLITFLLRGIPEVDLAFRSVETYGKIGKVISIVPHSESLNLLGILLALLVALITHAIQLHDRISDVFGIRRRFDLNKILLPLSKLVGITLTTRQVDAIRASRDSVMRDVFYRYASSRSDTPLVDKHDIEHALSAWSSFWALTEASLYFSIAGGIAWVLHDKPMAIGLAVTVLALVTLACLQHLRLGRYAKPQIEAIARDATASSQVQNTFHAL